MNELLTAQDGLPDARDAAFDAFDLDTAWLRRAESDSAGFLARFALIVAEALPTHAEVIKVRRGLFKKTEEIVGVTVTFDHEVYVMRLNEHHHLVTALQKTMTGVVLSTRDMPVQAWIAGLMGQVKARTQQAREVADLLRSL